MQTNILKCYLITISLLFINLLVAQTNLEANCDVPSSYLVGEYYIEDHIASVGPENGSSNFEPGTYMVTANGNARTFQTALLPGFTFNDFTVELNLDCGIIQITEIDINLTCTGPPYLFTETSDTEATTYDLNDDNTFIINYIEDPQGSCGGPYQSSFQMTKVCNTPENVSFSNVTASSIDMNWMDPNDAVNTNISYSIEYGLSGFSLGNGQTISDISDENYTIDNLQENTLYDFYIWTQCSDTNLSEVLGPFSYGTFTNPIFELAPNGVTCLCDNANIGDSGSLMINGEQKTFTKRNRSQLLELIENNINDPEITLTCTSGIQDMSYLFQDKFNFNEDIPYWDVSNVITMEGMFYNARDFNQNIDHWDVSNVTNMSYLFYSDFDVDPPYSTFNSPLESWDVSNVTNMSHMFECARVFNQPLSNWDVSNVTNMSYMFSKAVDFNQTLNDWNVSNVTNLSHMFKMVSAIHWFNNDYNRPMNNWDVSNVTNMSHMFEQCNNFNQLIDNWDVSNVTDMSSMFYSSNAFNQSIDNWDVSSVINMSDMFAGASDFNQSINSWDVSNVVFMEAMFSHCRDFNQPLNNWDVSNVVDMQYMFLGSDSFNQSLDDWDVSSVTNMGSMFLNSVYNQPLNNWDVSSVTFMAAMFASESSFNQPIGNWNVSNVEEMNSMFAISNFNQNISTWCVEHILTEPGSFSFNSPLQEDFKPNWGESCTLGLSENDRAIFSYYPNPIQDIIYLKANTLSIDSEVTILDITGKIVYRQNTSLSSAPEEIDVSFLNSGLYFLKITTNENYQVERLVKE